MKEKTFAVITILLIIAAVTLNTVKMHRDIDSVYDAVNGIELDKDHIDTKDNAKKAYEKFKKCETFIGLTVNHDDLSNIEESFTEMLGHLAIGDTDAATVTKNRLLDELSHLRRLSGFNIDAII